MAQTGETHQQALAALAKEVPDHFLIPPASSQPCVGRCQSEFSLASEAGRDGGSMVACGRCPGHVCLECGKAAVEEPFMRCDGCAEAINMWERAERLRARCAGRSCISKAHARTSDSDWADNVCDSCGEPICWCGSAPVDVWGGWCDRGCDDDQGWSDDQYRYDLQREFDYVVGLIAKLGGGSRRQVFGRLHRTMQAKAADATIDQLHKGISHAREWEQQLRAKAAPNPA